MQLDSKAGAQVLFGLGICLGIQWWLQAIRVPYFTGLEVPDSTPVSAPVNTRVADVFSVIMMALVTAGASKKNPCIPHWMRGFFV